MNTANLQYLQKIKSYLKGFEGEVFLDCGANDGCSAIKYLNEFSNNARIISFEPNPKLVRYNKSLLSD